MFILISGGNTHIRQDSMAPGHLLDEPVMDRRNNRRTLAQTLVGTPAYIAPEVWWRQPYSQSCDWWSVGVIFYEMVIGRPPFMDDDVVKAPEKVRNWQQHLEIPRFSASGAAESLITSLCCGADQRLGSGEAGATEIKCHPFFQMHSVDWVNLRRLPAPWRPMIAHPFDTSNFDEVKDAVDSDDSSDDEVASDYDEARFINFTWRRTAVDGGPPSEFFFKNKRDLEKSGSNSSASTTSGVSSIKSGTTNSECVSEVFQV